MSNEILNLLSYARKLWRRRWLVLSISILICAIGWPSIFAIPEKYEVKAKVYLDTQSILKPLLKGLAVEHSTVTQTTMVIRRTLLSRSNLEKVVHKTGLDQKVNTPEDFERVLKSLADKIDIEGGGPEQIYTMTYVDRYPERAKRVVEELLSLFVGGTLDETRQDTTSTQQFLNEQIKEYESKLEEAENNLKHFKRKNVGLMPEVGQTYFSQLSRSTDQLNTTKLELQEAVNRRNELKRQITGIKEPDDIPWSPVTDPLQLELNKLLVQYTEEHPDVIALKRQMSDESRQTKAQSNNNLEEQPSIRLHQNLAYQELKAALGKTEAEVAALRVRVKRHENRVVHLQQLIDTMPQVEAELVKLNRDYKIIKDNYEEMVRRREAAKITYEAEKSTDDVQFKVVEPPRTPLLPVSPRRLLLITALFAMGIGAGVGVALILTYVKPTFDTWQDLKDATNLPLFGVVSRVYTTNERIKVYFQSVSFWFVLITFVATFVLLAGMQMFHIKFIDLMNMTEEIGRI